MANYQTIPNNGLQVCPFGAAVKTPAVCATALDFLSTAFLAFVFPLGIPAILADVVAGLAVGTVLVADVCASAPQGAGPFDPAWLNPLTLTSDLENITSWLVRGFYAWVFNQCCDCSPPTSTPDWTLFAQGSLPGGSTDPALTQVYLWCGGSPGGGAWDVKVISVAYDTSGTTNHAVLTWWQGTTSNACGTPAAGLANAGDIAAWGPDVSIVYGTIETHTSLAVQQNTVMLTNLPGVGSSRPTSFSVFLRATGPVIVTNALSPPSLPSPPPAVPSAWATTVIPSPSASVGTCNFAPISAVGIEQLLWPQSRVSSGAPVAISGAGSLVVPAGIIGATVHVTAAPIETSHDAGDPARYYGLGWVAWSIDGVEIAGSPVWVAALQQQFWASTPTDRYLTYYLTPGVTVSLQWWGGATPT